MQIAKQMKVEKILDVIESLLFLVAAIAATIDL